MAARPTPGRAGEIANERALVYLYSRLPFLVQRVDQIATALFVSEAESLRITPLQFQLLDLLNSSGASSQVALARLCGIDTSTASLVLGNLIKARLIHRATDKADKRRKIVELTPAGQAIQAEAAQAYRRVQTRMFAALGEEKSEFVDAIERIVRNGVGAPPWEPLEAGLPSSKGCDAPVAASLSFLLRRTHQQAEASMTGQIGAHGLTIRQYATLFVICFHDGVTEAGIARMLGFEATNAALVVKLLVQKDLITADALHARGRKRYRASTAGKALLLAIEPALTRGETTLAADLSDAEITFVQRMLGRTIAAFDTSMRSPLTYFPDMAAKPQWPVPLEPHLVVEFAIA